MTSLDTLADEFWAVLLEHEPTWRHQLGDYTDVGRYEDPTRTAELALAARLRELAGRAEAIDPSGLGDQQRLTRAVLLSSANGLADLAESPLGDRTGDPVGGQHVYLAIVNPMLAIPTAEVAAAMPAKYAAMGTYFTALADRARAGVRSGWVSPRFAVEATVAQLDAMLATPLEQDPLLLTAPLPDVVDAAAFRATIVAAVREHLRPGLAAYRDALRDAVLPQARSDEQCGLSWLPGGDAAYATCLRYFTTTTLTAQQIHDIGLAQVAALADEYRVLGHEVLGTDDLPEIFDRMRTDPALHFETGEELVERSRVALARAEAAAGDWFSTLPKAPCAVEGTQSGPKAFYFPPAADGSRGGTFFVNVSDPRAWGRFELESMAFHEGVPGHHLQLAIAAELPDSIPTFRKHVHNSAYAEGWGLYTERLSDEMGLYAAPIDRLGMLSADSMRACRLVVDTGLHALGWSRQQAVDYLLANSPLTEGVVRPEVDRYICSPGQATSYMVGRLEIQRMRREAEQRQGDRFDIRAFHAVVLESGSLPLDVLDAHVAAALP